MKCRSAGFTLTELLIVVGIFSIIAAFTVPKLIGLNGDKRRIAIAKESVGTVKLAFSQYKLNQGISSTTTAADLAQYLNYVRVYTLVRDAIPGYNSVNCNTNCYELANGSVVELDSVSFDGTNPTNATRFYLDPESGYSGSTGDAIWFFLYFDGNVTSYADCKTGTDDSTTFNGAGCPAGSGDPAWFEW